MDKSQFTLSLGFVGVIMATYAGWGGVMTPTAHAAPWPLPTLAQPLR